CAGSCSKWAVHQIEAPARARITKPNSRERASIRRPMWSGSGEPFLAKIASLLSYSYWVLAKTQVDRTSRVYHREASGVFEKTAQMGGAPDLSQASDTAGTQAAPGILQPGAKSLGL